ncbi:putative 2-aminoethylphosphonate ABC transporter permease subunit [Atopomonas sediminilitoris]|uniref:putative 2-aminoethylphosphonate ABC transporter permease subunit n=1 Tax=Atopomonas sediminilitoris TaxID=2919919 RepID=UPI001F4EECFE|nr:putative 2-aminoethylphosphonate ABC transporter permease subunit [Atopomonas sediminilitoris]MCJ8170529.1 putative 2-aminoethylphosphonate ABC transporter permease subunit [Atopomonas sediminilitoris]
MKLTATAAHAPFTLPLSARQREKLFWALLMLLALAAFALLLLGPLYSLLSKSVADGSGQFVGLANFNAYLAGGGIQRGLSHSLWIASSSMLIVVSLAFACAWALTRTRLPLRGVIKALLMLPILAPSLLPALSLIYLFGEQGIFKSWLGDTSIYGPLGIVLGSCFWTFPHALMILLTAMSHADARHYEAADVLRASAWRTFFTVTLPNARYGLVSAAFVVFILVFTDFGVPKVIGGNYEVLATDIYKQVIGQQKFEMGAVISVLLLLPALLAFVADRWVQRRQAASVTARAVPYSPKTNRRRDLTGALLLSPVLGFILLVVGMAIYASLVRYWPYNLDLTLRNYEFGRMDGGGWSAYANSLTLASLTLLVGTSVVFFNAWLSERTPQPKPLLALFQLCSLLPLAVPGLTLGLAYIFFFNHPANPLNGLYGGMAILVMCTVAHFYSVAHLTALTSLKQLDQEFEAVGQSLRASRWRMLRQVTLPLSAPTLLDIALYLFVNAMTTVSAVIFLYGPDTALAAVAVLNMDEAGDTAPAAAMAVTIMATCLLAKGVHCLLSLWLTRHTQHWRGRA